MLIPQAIMSEGPAYPPPPSHGHPLPTLLHALLEGRCACRTSGPVSPRPGARRVVRRRGCRGFRPFTGAAQTPAGGKRIIRVGARIGMRAPPVPMSFATDRFAAVAFGIEQSGDDLRQMHPGFP